MNQKRKSDVLKWIRCWEEAGAVMERIRQAELADVDVQHAIENLDDPFESALLRSPPKTDSGLVELQAWLSKARQ